MKATFPLLLLFAFLTGVLFVRCSNEEPSNNTKKKLERTLHFERNIVFLSTKGDTLTTIKAAVADNDEERNQGLMDVKNLPKDKGMLFIFEDNQPRSFWMANTPLPLDIIFVNEHYEIVRIYHNAQPFSEKSLPSEQPAKYVIETNGGFSVSHDIQEGMKVSF